VTSLGVIFLPQHPPERLREIATAADESGLDELWLWEDCFFEAGLTSAAAVLGWTDRLRVGIGLLPVPLRNVALTAMELATLERLFPGRLRVAVGHGVQDWMAQVGARVDSPLTLLREYLDALRALLRGERVSVAGRYVRLDDVALDWPPAAAPAIFTGATGDRTLRLAGAAADGTVLTGGTTPAQVSRARRLIDEGRSEAGRTDPHRVAVYVHAATGADAADRLERERQHWGYDNLDELALTGDADAIAAGVRRFAAHGADVVVLQPTPDDPDPAGFVHFVATQVRSRLAGDAA
jgi:alkanesulfonate monooxygenase SsuD/methylene tetrahydromethanopterin reductase-like flavin-dependent oxidoreductase (luciferase family)